MHDPLWMIVPDVDRPEWAEIREGDRFELIASYDEPVNAVPMGRDFHSLRGRLWTGDERLLLNGG